jgi:hypothetical protein
MTASPWCSLEEAADRVRKSPKAFLMFLYRNRAKVRLKQYRIGKRLLFKVVDIDRLVEPVR